MALWLQVLIGILVVLAIIAVISIIVIIRRMNIVFKKVDYIVEDLTYKAESLASTIDAIKGFSKYILLIQSLIDEKDPKKLAYIQENRKKILALSNYLRKIAEESSKPNDKIN